MYLIQQNTFDIQCSSPSFGKEMQLQLGTLLEKIFYPRLEELFKKYDVPQQHWVIDTLEITIPEIHKKYWKEELVEKTLAKMEEYLIRYNPKSNKQLQENMPVESTMVPTEKKAVGLVFDFLRTGMLPSNTISSSLVEIIKEVRLDESFSKALMVFFKEDLKRVLRWVFSMPEGFRKEVLYFLPNPFQSILFSEMLLKNKEQLQKIKSHSISSIGNDVTRRNQWDELLQWVFLLQANGVEMASLSVFLSETVFPKYYGISPKELHNLLAVVAQYAGSEKSSIAKEIANFFGSWKYEIEKKIIHLELLQDKGIQLETMQDKEIEFGTTLEKEKNQMAQYSSELNFYYIKNAGLVLLHPFLTTLFEQLALTKNQQWESALAQQKGVLLTHYLVFDAIEMEESQLLLNKILCGVAPEEVINTQIVLEKHEKEKCHSLLEAVLEHWSIMKNSSKEALQETFLQREGKLEMQTSGYEMWIEEKGYDILLEQLPWGIGMVRTPWMNQYLTCNWNQ